MDAVQLRTFLREEFGIKNDDEFEKAVDVSLGINLGMFTQPYKGGIDDRKGLMK